MNTCCGVDSTRSRWSTIPWCAQRPLRKRNRLSSGVRCSRSSVPSRARARSSATVASTKLRKSSACSCFCTMRRRVRWAARCVASRAAFSSWRKSRSGAGCLSPKRLRKLKKQSMPRRSISSSKSTSSRPEISSARIQRSRSARCTARTRCESRIRSKKKSSAKLRCSTARLWRDSPWPAPFRADECG